MLMRLGGLLTLAAAALAATASPPTAGPDGKSGKFWVFVGTYTAKNSKGIYRLQLDAATGKLTDLELAAEVVQPSFLAIHPSQRFLYSVSEYTKGDKKAGALNAFALDPATGKLAYINQQSSGGGDPCHLVVDRDGQCVLATNYTGGSVCCLPIKKDGSLAEATSFIQLTGKSVNMQRQEGPHSHSINVDAADKFAFVADLGLDKVLVFHLDAKAGMLTPNNPPGVDLEPGAGPRHFAFHPNGKFGYVINELQSTVTAMSYDPAKGVLKKLQTISTLPQEHKGNSTAEVVVHPSGKWLYGSNRGHNSIAIFAIDEKTGELKAVGHQGKDIKTPRNFAIDPTGTWLIVANQDGDSLVVFRVDQKTGELTPTGVRVEVPRPVCVRFVAVAK
jgi:6-phosphogluconolactonase